MGLAREGLNQLSQRHPDVRFSWSDSTQQGPPHAPQFHVTLKVQSSDSVQAGARLFYGIGRRKREAQEQAAAAALDALDPPWRERLRPGSEEQLRLAHVGDAALDLLLSLLAFRNGLLPSAADDLRQRVLSNEGLGGGARGRFLATEAEARMGQALVQRQEALLQLLHAAADDADPSLMGTLRRAVGEK